MTIIDSHQHFWQYSPVRDTWMDESMKALRRDFMPPKLAAELQANGVAGSVAVQADQSEQETIFLLGLAERHAFIKGVVGWVDLRAENVEERLAHFSTYPKLKGFRHIVQGERDPDFMLGKAFLNGISHLEKYGFTYDILIFPHQLGAALELARQFPRQRFVVDHLAKPRIREGLSDGWAGPMAALGQLGNVWCKLSGMVTEADWNGWKYGDLLPYLDHVVQSFGPQKLMFGSDWPVCLLAGNYTIVKSILDRYLGSLPEAVRMGIWGGNAEAFYRLG
ncbi:MAG: amidohydrolase family protein [Lewinellaceae bacterium]|nr:amidohydrolase family protein [Saprospiraceae bacterium]MCB9341799.1 amidohydrolase family protein [Lewinellaceae bacterium]